MRLLFIIRLALLNNLTRPLRTSLTVAGIAISVTVIIFLLGLGNGLKAIVTTEISQSDSQSAVSVSSKRTKQLKLDQAALARLRSVSGVSQVEQLVGLSGRITYHGIALDLPIYAVTPGYLSIAPMQFIHGQPFTTQTQEDMPIIISPVALSALGIDNPDQAIGKTMALSLDIPKDYAQDLDQDVKQVERPDYKVSAIIDRGSMPVAYIPLKYVEEQGLTSVAEVKLMVATPDKISAVREGIEQMGFQTTSIHDTIEQVNSIFAIIQTILVVFGAITLAIAVFGTLNTITIALVEQTRQIGFLRILGIRRQDVGRLFIIQSALLSASGAVVGVVLGNILGLAANGVVMYLAARNGLVGLMVFQIPILPSLLIIASSVALGWVLGIGPARRATAMQPMAALRN